LWNVYAKDRPNLNMYYGKYLSYAIPVTDFSIEIRSKLLEQCVAHFPWPCAWFDCKHVSFPEGQRCGLQKNHDSSTLASPSAAPTVAPTDTDRKPSCFCPDPATLANLRPEFDMDEFYEGKKMNWKSWRGLYMGTRLQGNAKGRALIQWNDKIWLFQWFKARGIPMLPVVHTSKTSPSVKHIIQNMTDFAVKPGHTSSSMFMWIVKDGKMLTVPQSSKWSKRAGSVPKIGSVIDIEEVERSMQAAWKTHTRHEDWPRNNVPAGVIVEKLVSDNTELKYSVVWGKVVGFLVDGNSVEFFLRAGMKPTGHSVRYMWDGTPEKGRMNPKGIPPPHWWKRGLVLAETIARLAACDHVRVDLYFYEGQPVLNEFTWNPGGEAQDQPGQIVAETLNRGYSMRRAATTMCPCFAN